MQSLSLNLASNSFELIVKMVLCEANLIIKERERERERDKDRESCFVRFMQIIIVTYLSRAVPVLLPFYGNCFSQSMSW